MSGYYQLKRAASSQFVFNLKAGNDETLLTSESYTQKVSAVGAIASCRKNSASSQRYEKLGEYNFVLKAPNGEIIGRSETYTTKAACSAGIAACMMIGPFAPTDDQA